MRRVALALLALALAGCTASGGGHMYGAAGGGFSSGGGGTAQSPR